MIQTCHRCGIEARILRVNLSLQLVWGSCSESEEQE